MKKLLLLAGILVVGATSFAWPNNNAGMGTLEVKANVVRDLEVETTPVDFGNVAAGMKEINPKKRGTITVKADKEDGVNEARVKIELYAGSKGEVIGDNGVELNREGFPSSANLRGDKLVYHPSFSSRTVQMKDGAVTVPIGGILNVPDVAYPGNYSANIRVKASYTKFAND